MKRLARFELTANKKIQSILGPELYPLIEPAVKADTGQGFVGWILRWLEDQKKQSGKKDKSWVQEVSRSKLEHDLERINAAFVALGVVAKTIKLNAELVSSALQSLEVADIEFFAQEQKKRISGNQMRAEFKVWSPHVVQTLNFEAAATLHGNEAPRERQRTSCAGRTCANFDEYGGPGKSRFLVYPDGPTMAASVGKYTDIPYALNFCAITTNEDGSLYVAHDSQNRDSDGSSNRSQIEKALAILESTVPGLDFDGDHVGSKYRGTGEDGDEDGDDEWGATFADGDEWRQAFNDDFHAAEPWETTRLDAETAAFLANATEITPIMVRGFGAQFRDLTLRELRRILPAVAAIPPADLGRFREWERLANAEYPMVQSFIAAKIKDPTLLSAVLEHYDNYGAGPLAEIIRFWPDATPAARSIISQGGDVPTAKLWANSDSEYFTVTEDRDEAAELKRLRLSPHDYRDLRNHGLGTPQKAAQKRDEIAEYGLSIPQWYRYALAGLDSVEKIARYFEQQVQPRTAAILEMPEGKGLSVEEAKRANVLVMALRQAGKTTDKSAIRVAKFLPEAVRRFADYDIAHSMLLGLQRSMSDEYAMLTNLQALAVPPGVADEWGKQFADLVNSGQDSLENIRALRLRLQQEARR
jgi:hypothetical protein